VHKPHIYESFPLSDASSPYFGHPIGRLSNREENLSGQLFAVDKNTVFIQNLTYLQDSREFCSNAENQNVESQNVESQNVECQNVEHQNVEHQNVERQNVEKLTENMEKFNTLLYY
jgi:hypothetical protein